MEAIKDPRGGPWRALQTYREKPTEERFGHLTSALVHYYGGRYNSMTDVERSREKAVVRHALGTGL